VDAREREATALAAAEKAKTWQADMFRGSDVEGNPLWVVTLQAPRGDDLFRKVTARCQLSHSQEVYEAHVDREVGYLRLAFPQDFTPLAVTPWTVSDGPNIPPLHRYFGHWELDGEVYPFSFGFEGDPRLFKLDDPPQVLA
jgi:hypothetical protein